MPDGATVIDHALKQARQRNRIRVGVSLGFHGLSAPDIHGRWTGFDVDIARAISVALFGDADRVEFVPLSSAERFDALEAGDIDVGSYNASITYSRESRHDATFVHPILFDGEVFATRPENLRGTADGASVRDVIATRIGMLAGSTTADNVERYCGRAGIDYTAVLFRTPQEALNGYLSGKTDVYCLDSYLLAGELSGAGEIDRHVFLADQVSLEAMSPVARTRDWQLVKAVRWVLFALIESDNLGLTQGNLAEASRSPSRYLGRFLAPDADSVRHLGLVPEFTTRIIEQVGSYADVFDRHLGARSALQQERRANGLRGDGGMLYAPLFI
ncbi:amino acid ABC transporter substrate-binding protein [Kineosporia mesophila]|uniref:Amino acid ABC transporter substrate-binding protein n=1 Tax=Kineosporia mesophila TaxID=566012 RepID=A0ABP7AMF1_9ACTN